MIVDLHETCPACSRKLAPIKGAQLVATVIYTRRCRSCRVSWQIKVAPEALSKGRGYVHTLTFRRKN